MLFSSAPHSSTFIPCDLGRYRISVLGHEIIHALNNAEGKHHYGTDPAPPASEPTINEEEAATIGTGSHAADPLTENTFRNDLGQGRRDNHYGEASPTGPTGSLRPGGY